MKLEHGGVGQSNGRWIEALVMDEWTNRVMEGCDGDEWRKKRTWWWRSVSDEQVCQEVIDRDRATDGPGDIFGLMTLEGIGVFLNSFSIFYILFPFSFLFREA